MIVAIASGAHLMHPVPARQLAIVRRMGIEIAATDRAVPTLDGVAVVLDGLLGYGLSGPPHGRAADLIRAANDSTVPVLALDVPSGLSSDTGEALDPTIRVRQTLTRG